MGKMQGLDTEQARVPARQARAFVDRREAARQAALDQRFVRAQRDARAIISLIVSAYRPRRIFQWGSLLDRRRFWEQSDIDIAVEGVTEPEQFFRMLAEADGLTDFPLDLVPLENVEPEFNELITRNGRLVYEQRNPDSDPHR
jgi:predicted nucleotidyltransferase